MLFNTSDYSGRKEMSLFQVSNIFSGIDSPQPQNSSPESKAQKRNHMISTPFNDGQVAALRNTTYS